MRYFPLLVTFVKRWFKKRDKLINSKALPSFYVMKITPRRQDILASNLLFGLLIFDYAQAAVYKYIIHRASLLDIGFKAVIATVLIMSTLYYFIRQGKTWAKALFLISFIWQIVAPALDYAHIIPRLQADFSVVFNYLLSYTIQGWATWLMFRKLRAPVPATN